MLAAFVAAPYHLMIDRPAGAAMSRRLTGRALMTPGWRLRWDGTAAGPGDDVARFTIRARPADGIVPAGTLNDTPSTALSFSR